MSDYANVDPVLLKYANFLRSSNLRLFDGVFNERRVQVFKGNESSNK